MRGEIFHTRPDRPWVPPSLLYNGYRVFPGGKAAEAWRRPPTPSSAEVKARVELYPYSPCEATVACSSVKLTFTLFQRSRVTIMPPLLHILSFIYQRSCTVWQTKVSINNTLKKRHLYVLTIKTWRRSET